MKEGKVRRDEEEERKGGKLEREREREGGGRESLGRSYRRASESAS